MSVKQQPYTYLSQTTTRAQRMRLARQQQRAARAAYARQGIVAAARPSVSYVRQNAGEKKGVDTSLEITGPIAITTNTNTDSFVLNLIRTGNGSWNRVGRKVFLKSIRLRGQAIFVCGPEAVSATRRGGSLRMVLVWDKQPSGGAIPAFDAIFGHTNQDGSEATTFTDAIKYDNMGRFKILKDCMMDVNPTAINTETDKEIVFSHSFDEYVPLKNKVTIFSGESAPMTIADISTGALYVYFRASVGTNNINDFSISNDSYARLRYSD